MSPTIQDAKNSSTIRMIIASESPTIRARRRCDSGSRLVRIEMNTMLSIPSTSSRTNRVRKATQISGLVRRSTRAIVAHG